MIAALIISVLLLSIILLIVWGNISKEEMRYKHLTDKPVSEDEDIIPDTLENWAQHIRNTKALQTETDPVKRQQLSDWNEKYMQNICLNTIDKDFGRGD